MIKQFQKQSYSPKASNDERMNSFQRFMNTDNEQCTLTPGQPHIKASSICKSVLQIYYQNIQGSKWKSDEIFDFFCPVFPHVMCVTEHHFK